MINMAQYLIEFRFFGKAKYEMKDLIYRVQRKFRLRTKRAIPHVTLVGGITTNNEHQLVYEFNKICNESPLMGMKIDGYEVFEENKVVFVNIEPSQELENFRWSLSKNLQPYCALQRQDYAKNFAFHATIAMKLDYYKFNQIKNYVNQIEEPKYKHFLLRATLLKNGKILVEYDFLQRRLLNRGEAKSGANYRKTMHLLQEFFAGRHNPDKNIKAIKENIDETEFIEQDTFNEQEEQITKELSIIDKIKSLFGKPKTFITSDLHLGHANIIKYCNRPFSNVHEMNKTLIANWNKTINKKDTVYFLGDLNYGKNSKSTDYWLNKLNGKIVFIGGNHDRSYKTRVHKGYQLDYGGIKFFLVHDPKNAPIGWSGWVIHGHHHNNKLGGFPLIDKSKKTINVSVELTDYKPLSMDEIIKMISLK